MNDMRERLIALLCDGTAKTETCDLRDDCATAKGDCGFCTIMADHLIAHGVTVQEWISVEDRLPAKGTGKVLVIKRFNGKSYVDIGEVIEGKAYCYSDDYCIKPKEHIFTHWMPLPPAPRM